MFIGTARQCQIINQPKNYEDRAGMTGYFIILFDSSPSGPQIQDLHFFDCMISPEANCRFTAGFVHCLNHCQPSTWTVLTLSLSPLTAVAAIQPPAP